MLLPVKKHNQHPVYISQSHSIHTALHPCKIVFFHAFLFALKGNLPDKYHSTWSVRMCTILYLSNHHICLRVIFIISPYFSQVIFIKSPFVYLSNHYISQDDSEGLSAFALVHFYASPTLLPFQRQNQLLADLKNNLKFNEYVPELGAFDQETLYKRQSTEDEEKL